MNRFFTIPFDTLGCAIFAQSSKIFPAVRISFSIIVYCCMSVTKSSLSEFCGSQVHFSFAFLESLQCDTVTLHIKEVLVGTFWKQMKAEFGQVHCPASSNFQAQFSTLCQTLPKMFMGSNIVVLYSAQYSVGCRTGKDRDSEIWTCKKMQARQHCFDSKRNVTSRATFPLLSVHCDATPTNNHSSAATT